MQKKNSDVTHHGHRRRMIENFMSVSDFPLTDVQYLEMLLFYCIPRADTNPIAHRLLDKFKDIQAVLHASESELESVSGIGKGTAKKFKQIANLAHTYTESAKASRRNTEITKKQIADTIMISMREVCTLNDHKTPYLLMCFSDTGELLFQKAIRSDIVDALREFSSLGRDRWHSIGILCIPETRLSDPPELYRGENVLSNECLRKFKIDVIAFLSTSMMIKFEVL